MAVLFKLFSSWHTNNFWIWQWHTYFMMAKTYCYMDQTFYKLFVKTWNFRGTLQSLSRHTNVPRHTGVWETLICGYAWPDTISNKRVSLQRNCKWWNETKKLQLMKLSKETANDEVKQVWYTDDSSAVGSLAGVKNGGNTYRPMDQTLGTAPNLQRQSS